MARDIQMRLVYAWEREAYPGYFDKARSMVVPEAREMIRKVHADVRSAGGFAHEAPVVKFTKRNGSACASWGRLKFTPSMLTPEIVLHEIAHSLTWNYEATRVAMRLPRGQRGPWPCVQNLRSACSCNGPSWPRGSRIATRVAS